MNKIKRDLNFFKAYKSSSSKAGGSGYKGVVIVIICFVLVIAGAFGVLYSVQTNLRRLSDSIKAELSKPEIIEAQNKLAVSSQKKEMMTLYISSLELAKKNFDQSKVIDAGLFHTISSCLPEDVTVKSLNINAQSVQLTCTADDMLSPAVIVQAFKAEGIFGNIKYDGITKNEETGKYLFTVTCFFGAK